MPKRRRGMPTAERRQRIAHVWMVVAAVVLVINGVTVTTLLTRDGDDRKEAGLSGVYDDSRAEDAIDVAQTQVLGVVSLDAASDDREIDELAERTTATFRTDFDTFVSDFLGEVQAKGIEVRSRIEAAGIAELVGDHATIIVATSGDARKDDATPARARDFSMLVGLAYTSDGWRVEQMEFL